MDKDTLNAKNINDRIDKLWDKTWGIHNHLIGIRDELDGEITELIDVLDELDIILGEVRSRFKKNDIN